MPKLSAAKLEARRMHILQAAARCFERDGFHRTTIEDVQREAGVSTGAIYTYFPNKEAIIRAMLESAQDSRSQELERASLVAADGKDADREVLMAWTRRVFTEEGIRDARVDVNLWAEALRDRNVAELARRALENATHTVAGVVERGMKRDGRELPGIHPRDVSSVLVAILLGLEIQSALGVKLDAERVMRVLAELFPAPAAANAKPMPSKQRGTRRAARATPGKPRSR